MRLSEELARVDAVLDDRVFFQPFEPFFHARLGRPSMVLAEKIVTAIDRGEQNTRWRDFVDIDALTRTRRILYTDLRGAIETVARYRQVQLQPLRPLLDLMPELAQRKWITWRRKQRLEGPTPEHFGDLLKACMAFADPVLDSTADGRAWDPMRKAWLPTAT